MATITTLLPTDELLEASKCYDCIPSGEQNAVIIYLLNQILGTGLTVQQLLDQSKCYKCVPGLMQKEVIIYLLNQLLP